MILQTSKTDQLYISKFEDYYLCSCPKMMPSFVVRHSSPEDAQKLMINILNYITNGHPINFPLSEIQFSAGTRNEIFYRVECPQLLPGIIAYGHSEQMAIEVLSHKIQNFFKCQSAWSHPITIKKENGAYSGYCQSVLPFKQVNCMSLESAHNEMAKTICDYLLREDIQQRITEPNIVVGSFHSGTSALALLFLRNNIAMGTSLNYAYDELEIHLGNPNIGLRGFDALIKYYYPQKQFSISKNEKASLRNDFFRMLQSKVAYPYWGWKGPTSTYLMPLIKEVLPGAKFIHIVRDGRDVALSPHSDLPNNPFRKILYFDRPDVAEWNGIKLTRDFGANLRSNEFDPPPTLNEYKCMAYLWEKMSMLGEKYGRELGEAYMQVRFENLCLHPERTVAEISEFMDIPLDSSVVSWQKDRVGKYKRPPAWVSPECVRTIENQCVTGLKHFNYS